MDSEDFLKVLGTHTHRQKSYRNRPSIVICANQDTSPFPRFSLARCTPDNVEKWNENNPPSASSSFQSILRTTPADDEPSFRIEQRFSASSKAAWKEQRRKLHCRNRNSIKFEGRGKFADMVLACGPGFYCWKNWRTCRQGKSWVTKRAGKKGFGEGEKQASRQG